MTDNESRGRIAAMCPHCLERYTSETLVAVIEQDTDGLVAALLGLAESAASVQEENERKFGDPEAADAALVAMSRLKEAAHALGLESVNDPHEPEEGERLH